jgi:LysM repeat protein
LNRNPEQQRANLPVAPAWNGGNPGQAAAPLAGQTPRVNIPSPATLGEPAAAPAGYAAPLGSNAERGLPPAYRSPNAAAQGNMPDAAATPLHYESFMRMIRTQLDAGKLSEAHLLLSPLHDDRRLTPSQAKEVTQTLLQLAGTVIYSNQHLLEAPYTVRSGETIEQIAAAYKIPPQLLARINLIRDGEQPPAGTQLKVIRGPFSAVVHLERYELVLMLNERYAGRIAIGIGQDQPNLEGDFQVRTKTLDPAYHGQVFIGAGDPNNPLGKMLIDLGGHVALHGTNNPAGVGRYQGRGTIRLANADIEDLFRILSVGSAVKIRR